MLLQMLVTVMSVASVTTAFSDADVIVVSIMPSLHVIVCIRCGERDAVVYCVVFVFCSCALQ